MGDGARDLPSGEAGVPAAASTGPAARPRGVLEGPTFRQEPCTPSWARESPGEAPGAHGGPPSLGSTSPPQSHRQPFTDGLGEAGHSAPRGASCPQTWPLPPVSTGARARHQSPPKLLCKNSRPASLTFATRGVSVPPTCTQAVPQSCAPGTRGRSLRLPCSKPRGQCQAVGRWPQGRSPMGMRGCHPHSLEVRLPAAGPGPPAAVETAQCHGAGKRGASLTDETEPRVGSFFLENLPCCDLERRPSRGGACGS